MEGEIKEKPALNIDLLCKIQGLKGFVLNTKAHERSSQTARETTWPGRPIVEHCLLFSHLILYTVESVLGRWDTRQLFMLDINSAQFWVMWSLLHRHIVQSLACLRQNLPNATHFKEFLCPPVEFVSTPLPNLSVLSRLEELYSTIWLTFYTCFGQKESWFICLCDQYMNLYQAFNSKQSWFCILFFSLNVLINFYFLFAI